MTLKKEAS